jgi:dihydrofolate reductase
MGKLTYSTNLSLDGFVADKEGQFQWAAPDEEVFAFINELVRPETVQLYGRRMYEIMTYWQTEPVNNEPGLERDFATMWRAAEKVVYSSTLTTPSTPKTRIEKVFEPEAVRGLKESTQGDLSISGPTLAAHAFRAGLVDECHLFVKPILVGGGLRAFPTDFRSELHLEEERRFRSGIVYLKYRLASAPLDRKA